MQFEPVAKFSCLYFFCKHSRWSLTLPTLIINMKISLGKSDNNFTYTFLVVSFHCCFHWQVSKKGHRDSCTLRSTIPHWRFCFGEFSLKKWFCNIRMSELWVRCNNFISHLCHLDCWVPLGKYLFIYELLVSTFEKKKVWENLSCI